MNTLAMSFALPSSLLMTPGGHCFYELGSPLVSHAPARHPTGPQTGREPHPHRVGSRERERPAEHLDRVWPDTGHDEIL